jgi:hypothetical protein
MRRVFITLTLLASTAAFAQTGSVNRPTLIVTGNCPVGLTAQQSALGTTIWTTSLEDLRPGKPTSAKDKNGTGIHVELNSPNDKSIRQVELLVHYTLPGLHALEINSSGPQPLIKHTKTFDLAASTEGSLKLTGDLFMGPVSSIGSVSVFSIHYADGSIWQSNAHQSCDVELNHFLLVSTP